MGATLLIVDTDPVFRYHLARHLQNEKWKILFAGGISEAGKTVRRSNVDVALLGLDSLKREGLAILRMIKKIRSRTEVIMLGSADQIEVSIEGMKLGAFDDFMGPLDIEVLIRRIEDARVHKREKEKQHRPLIRRYMEVFAAGAFAEAGEPDMALEYVEKSRRTSIKNGKKEKRDGED